MTDVARHTEHFSEYDDSKDIHKQGSKQEVSEEEPAAISAEPTWIGRQLKLNPERAADAERCVREYLANGGTIRRLPPGKYRYYGRYDFRSRGGGRASKPDRAPRPSPAVREQLYRERDVRSGIVTKCGKKFFSWLARRKGVNIIDQQIPAHPLAHSE